MKRQKNRRKTFTTSKRLRIELLGEKCELCNNPHEIGHHAHGKSKNGLYDIMLRCWSCEKQCHREHLKGNPWWSNRILQQNNNEIHRILKANF